MKYTGKRSSSIPDHGIESVKTAETPGQILPATAVECASKPLSKTGDLLSAFGDKDGNSLLIQDDASLNEENHIDTPQNSIKTVSVNENPDLAVQDVEEPSCEDGTLCVCAVGHSVKSLKRKCDGESLSEVGTKRKCSGKKRDKSKLKTNSVAVSNKEEQTYQKVNCKPDQIHNDVNEINYHKHDNGTETNLGKTERQREGRKMKNSCMVKEKEKERTAKGCREQPARRAKSETRKVESESVKPDCRTESVRLKSESINSRRTIRVVSKDLCKNTKKKTRNSTADNVLLEKLKNQVSDKRFNQKAQQCRSQAITKTKNTSNKGRTKRFNISLPDLDSFDDDSVSATTSTENHFKQDSDRQFSTESTSFDTNRFSAESTSFDINRFSESVSFDINLDKDECEESDTDDDLPDVLTPIKIEKYFQEKDIVWVKWKGWPYLPAMVKRVYNKKKKITCLMFTPEDRPEKPLTVSTGGGKVWSYFDTEKKEKILKSAEELEPETKKYFQECLKKLDIYLTKKALGIIKDDYAFFNPDGLYDEELSDGEVESERDEKEFAETCDQADDDGESGNWDVQNDTDDFKLSKKGEMRKEKIRQKTQKLVDFMMSQSCKEYLQNLFMGKIECERHKIFMTGTTKERARLKHQGYGPIDDEDQIMCLLLKFDKWLKEVNKDRYFNDTAYVTDVWAPEAIVFAYQKHFTYSKKKAWEMFFKGVRRTKEELEVAQKALMENLLKMSPEEKRRMRERHEEVLRQAGIEPVKFDYNVKNMS